MFKAGARQVNLSNSNAPQLSEALGPRGEALGRWTIFCNFLKKNYVNAIG